MKTITDLIRLSSKYTNVYFSYNLAMIEVRTGLSHKKEVSISESLGNTWRHEDGMSLFNSKETAFYLGKALTELPSMQNIEFDRDGFTATKGNSIVMFSRLSPVFAIHGELILESILINFPALNKKSIKLTNKLRDNGIDSRGIDNHIRYVGHLLMKEYS